jgi:hypothetical protein
MGSASKCDLRGRAVNQELGQYKGYPLDPDEWPEKLNEISEDGDR